MIAPLSFLQAVSKAQPVVIATDICGMELCQYQFILIPHPFDDPAPSIIDESSLKNFLQAVDTAQTSSSSHLIFGMELHLYQYIMIPHPNDGPCPSVMHE